MPELTNHVTDALQDFLPIWTPRTSVSNSFFFFFLDEQTLSSKYFITAHLLSASRPRSRLISPLARVLHDSWDEMCESKKKKQEFVLNSVEVAEKIAVLLSECTDLSSNTSHKGNSILMRGVQAGGGAGE